MAIKKQKLGAGTLFIGETGSGQEFSKQLTNAAVEPSYSDGDKVYVLSGDVDEEEAEWEGTLTGEFFQDYDMESLVAWTWENDGETLPFTFVPRKDAGLEVSGVVKVRPVTIGGEVNTENTSEFEWNLPMKPTIQAISDPEAAAASTYAAPVGAETAPAIAD